MCRVNTSTHCHTLSIHLHIRGISQLRMSIPVRQAKLESWCTSNKWYIDCLGENAQRWALIVLERVAACCLWRHTCFENLMICPTNTTSGPKMSQTHLDGRNGRMIWRCLAPLGQWMFLVVPGDSERFWIGGNGSQPALSFCILYCLIWIYLDIIL
jgi:hypothetical protein